MNNNVMCFDVSVFCRVISITVKLIRTALFTIGFYLHQMHFRGFGASNDRSNIFFLSLPTCSLNKFKHHVFISVFSPIYIYLLVNVSHEWLEFDLFFQQLLCEMLSFMHKIIKVLQTYKTLLL